ncbi:MAG: hypothetical protein RID09_07015 [Coleofasciculus sp. G1-WW12-02]|uniref:hypothetical protein n=1 Tax=Coleofasciculus sp. G1-WW12-02 TaxID=3068483 RepID=UPI0032F87551
MSLIKMFKTLLPDSLNILNDLEKKLGFYASRRLNKKKPDEYLEILKSRELIDDLKIFSERISFFLKTSLKEFKAEFIQQEFSCLVSDFNLFILKSKDDCNLRKLPGEIFNLLDTTLNILVESVDFAIQFSLFNSRQGFTEKLFGLPKAAKVMIRGQWVHILACVGKALVRIIKKAPVFPLVLTVAKANWQSVIKGRQLNLGQA